MRFHIVFGRETDLKGANEKADAGESPRHVMGLVADALGATVHWPQNEQVTALDKIRQGLFGPGADLWAFARRLNKQLGPGDIVYCMGEDAGVPMAALRRTGVKLAVMFHNIDRPRGRLALRLLNLRRRIDLCFTVAVTQADCLRHSLGFSADYVHTIDDNTDTDFFSPGPQTPDKARPLIISVGLEQRDYRTLAAATSDLDVDVRISGFSRDAVAVARAFPEAMPANMNRRFYDWGELRQLYRDADLVVVSARDNGYAAGIQGVMEGMASGRPVIASRTRGMAAYLASVPVTVFEPGDTAGLRAAIVETLANAQKGAQQGAAGREVALARHAQSHYATVIEKRLRALSTPATMY